MEFQFSSLLNESFYLRLTIYFITSILTHCKDTFIYIEKTVLSNFILNISLAKFLKKYFFERLSTKVIFFFGLPKKTFHLILKRFPQKTIQVKTLRNVVLSYLNPYLDCMVN